MPDYAAMKKEYPKLKASLTRAKNSKDPQKVLAAVAVAFARFDEIGWPDGWALWKAAERDARSALARNRPFL